MRQMLQSILPQIPEDTEDWVEDDDTENQITPPSDQEVPIEGLSEIKQHMSAAGPSNIEQQMPATSPSRIEQRMPAAGSSSIEQHIPAAGPSRIEQHIPAAGPSRIERHMPAGGPSRIEQHMPAASPSRIEQHIPAAGPSKIEQQLSLQRPLKIEQHVSAAKSSSIKHVSKIYVNENAQSTSDDDLEELNNIMRMQENLQALTSDLEFIRSQVALEQKRRDIAAYEAKNFTARISARVTLPMIAKLLGNFRGDPEDFPAWSKQLLALERTYGLSSNETKILMGMRMQGRAKKWLLWNSEIVDTSTENILEKLKNMFYYKSSKIVLRKQFENRKWRHQESFFDYFYDKIIIANRIPIDDKRELVDSIIDGIQDTILKNQARMHCFQTPEALLQAFELMSLSAGISKKNQS